MMQKAEYIFQICYLHVSKYCIPLPYLGSTSAPSVYKSEIANTSNTNKYVTKQAYRAGVCV